MATALASQLAQISGGARNPLDLKAKRKAHSQSLLFEPQEAISQDFDTLYEIGTRGFQDLCLQDSRFYAFSRSLFGENCRAIERTSLTQQQNDDLDAVVEDFLHLVATKATLKPAIKSIEWIIRRFRWAFVA